MVEAVTLGKVLLRAVKDTHHDGTGSVGTLVLRQIVGSREFFSAIGALERLIVGVERPVVALQVFLAAEATRAQIADEGLGRVLGKRLLTATAAGRCSGGGLIRTGVASVIGRVRSLT